MPISWMGTWQVQTAGNVQLISPESTDGYLATREGCAEIVPHSFVYWSSITPEEYLHELRHSSLHPLRCWQTWSGS